MDGAVKLDKTAERRQVTILHCDIVNSTAIVDSLDPEDVLLLMEANLNKWTKIVEEFRGTFVGYTGDGFQAYFGYPFAREDAAVDALTAALQVSRMFAAQDNKPQKELECRIGIATGQVVVGQPNMEQIGRRIVAFGSTPCLATRLEQAAKPGHILIDSATRKLTEGRFVFREVGPIQAKGFKHDVNAWEVVRKRRPGSRFDPSHLSPYVGRSKELESLSSQWQSVVSGEGQVILLHGEAGIGKSRLAFELERTLGSDIGKSFRFQCSSVSTSTPLHPWVHWAQCFANIQQQDGPETVHTKLHDTFHNKLGYPRELLNFFEAIMGLSPTGTEDSGEPPPENMLMALQQALVESLVKTAKDAPIFVLIEDIHWMDASTEGLIELLVERTSKERIFLVLTCRPENVPSFAGPHVTSVCLTRLDDEDVSALVATFFSEDERTGYEAALMSTIEKCEGNPLFVEEFSKHYLEHESPVSLASEHRSNIGEVPFLLQGSLLERIDAAGRGKEIAQLAAVIGPEFDLEILIKLSGDSPESVHQVLDQLNELNILNRVTAGDRVIYAFRHALLRDAVYSSLLHTARSAIHLNVASVLAGAGQTYSAEIIARHFEYGNDLDSAFIYWLEAGQHALQSGATPEAVNLLASALRVAQDLEETPQRLQDLTSMYLAYGHALNASLGVAAEPIKYFQKAEELAERLDDVELILESLDWQFGVQFNAGELRACREPAMKMKRLGLTSHDRRATASGFQGLGMAHFMRGEFTVARNEFEQGLEASGDYISGKHCFPSMSLSYLAWTNFILGVLPEAVSCAERAIASARRESPHAIAAALSNCSYVYQCIGDVDKVYAFTDELLEYAKKHGELIILERGNMTRNWAECISGRNDSAIDAIEAHINLLLGSGEEIEVTYHLGVLADLQIRQGRYADADKSLDKALQFASKNGENFYVSELYRLKAHFLKRSPDARARDDGCRYLLMAENTAKSQQAKAWLTQLAIHSEATVN